MDDRATTAASHPSSLLPLVFGTYNKHTFTCQTATYSRYTHTLIACRTRTHCGTIACTADRAALNGRHTALRADDDAYENLFNS